MTVEPISTAMSLQAQDTAAISNSKVEPAQVSNANTKDSQAAERVDETTSVVENSKSKQESSYENSEFPTTSENLKKAIESINKKMNDSECVYGIHEGTNRVTIKIIDRQTKKVLKELPPEKTLDMISRVWEMAGILVDEKR